VTADIQSYEFLRIKNSQTLTVYDFLSLRIVDELIDVFLLEVKVKFKTVDFRTQTGLNFSD
jgi:hypothetical protein